MKILFNGCSCTQGIGLDNTYNDPSNFTNVFSSKVFPGAEVSNISKSGNSNRDIFESTLEALTSDRYDKIFVGWTAYPRNHFYFSFEPEHWGYPGHFFSPRHINENYADWRGLTGKQLGIANEVLSNIHDHYEILSVLKYSKILKMVFPETYFVNILLPWSRDFFTKKSWEFPNELDDYTKRLLDVDARSDEEIKMLYETQHLDYQRMINGDNKFWDNWLNLYDSMLSLKLDAGNDRRHPGPLTHVELANFLESSYYSNKKSKTGSN